MPFTPGLDYTFVVQMSAKNYIYVTFYPTISGSCSAYTIVVSSGVRIAVLANSDENYAINGVMVPVSSGAASYPQTNFGTSSPTGAQYQEKFAWVIEGIPVSCLAGAVITFRNVIAPGGGHGAWWWWGYASTANTGYSGATFKRSANLTDSLAKRTTDEPGYAGCYQDYAVPRDLPYYGATSSSMTPGYCMSLCGGAGYNYAGIQSSTGYTGDQCWCGQSYGKFGAVSDSRCDIGCSGDGALYCGGYGVNSIYFVPQFLGCYQDYAMPRDLPYLIATSSSMTPWQCIDLCNGPGYAYAGVQSGNECWCGERYGKFGAVAPSRCSTPCYGDPGVNCGGLGVSSIYAIPDPGHTSNIEPWFYYYVYGAAVGSVSDPATAATIC